MDRLTSLRLFLRTLDRGGINNLDNYNIECLSILSRDVLRKISICDPEWEKMVPESVANVIKDRKYFEYQCPITTRAVES